MPRRLALFLCLFLGLGPALAEAPNLAAEGAGVPGAASQLVLAQRTYRMASASGDPMLLLAAIRLARGVTTRPALGWDRLTEAEAIPAPAPERAGPPDPGSDAALAVLHGMAIDDPNLQDLAYDLDAQVPHGRVPVVTVAAAALDGGAADDWRMPLSGAVPVEIAVLGDGSTALGLTVADDSGAVVCTRPPALDPALCRFTPARNGFFIVQVTNTGAEWNSYQLIGN